MFARMLEVRSLMAFSHIERWSRQIAAWNPKKKGAYGGKHSLDTTIPKVHHSILIFIDYLLSWM